MKLEGDDARIQMIEYVVSKRQANFDYIKRAHAAGGFFYLNTVRLEPQDIARISAAYPESATRFFYLGISVASLLHKPNGMDFVRPLAQLLEEYEYHHASSTHQQVMRLKARTELQPPPSPSHPVRPAVIRKSGRIVYQHLQLPNVPCPLDYQKALHTLCEVLSLVYRKFVDPSSASPAVHEAILAVDERIRRHVIAVACDGLARAAVSVAADEAAAVDSVFASAFATSVAKGGGGGVLSLFSG